MRSNRFMYVVTGSLTGLLLMGLGWGFSNFYLVAAGAVVVAAAVAWLSMPMSTIL
jgi:Flp pilus assembly protein TadB